MPTAAVRFLENDTHTKQIAKPQLRGAEGQEMTLNLGEEIPVISTVFGAAVSGGFASIPQSSFNYRPVGVNIAMTPRVTYEGEVILDLTVESSTLGASISVAGQDVPSFGSRKVKTRLRLREGESNLLAGLLRDDQRKSLTGFPGVMRVPVLRSLFGSTSDTINQTDIVMLLTPHIVRTHELTADDLAPIYIGTQQNVGLSGPPPLIAPVPNEEPAPAASAAFRRSDQDDSRNAAARTCAAAGGGAARRAAAQHAAAARNVARCRTSRRRRLRRWSIRRLRCRQDRPRPRRRRRPPRRRPRWCRHRSIPIRRWRRRRARRAT